MSDDQRGGSNSGGGRRRKRGGRGGDDRQRGPHGHGGSGRGDGRGPRRDGRGRDGGHPGGGGGRQRHQKPACEIVVAAEGSSVAADIYRTDVPPEWREIPPVVFFKSGVFVRAQGAVKQIARDLSVDRAVVYAVWEDPTATYVFEGRETRPGVTCAVLVPSSDPDGPPWLPIQAVVGSGQAEMESGILSPWLDQVACARFRPQFAVAKRRLNVSTDPTMPVEPDRVALRDTLKWLVDHPDVDNPSVRLARVMLVDDGHGLQRYGVSLMHAPDEEKHEALETILRPLAPEVGALMSALWDVWASPRALREAAEVPEAVTRLASAVERGLSDGSPLQQPSSLALITAWTAGLFGVRAERSGRQPARTLFAVARALRAAGRQMKALEHADSPLPRFPLDRAENSELLRDMSRLPRHETNLERLFRALSVSESAWYFARPRRDHLRPFRIVFPMIRGYPNAARSFLGRFDHVFTGWSFRGAELRDDGVPEGALAGVFITRSASVTSARAFARTVATPSKTGASVAGGLASLPDAPILSAIGGFRAASDEEVVASYQDAVGHDRMTWLRLHQAVAAAEYLITRSEHGEPAEGFALLPPAVAGDPEAGVRSHFMYWRMFCRSVAWKLPDVYGDFVDAIGARFAELPPKLQTEVFALIRRWGLHSDENRARATQWSGWLTEAAATFFETDDRTWLDGEWLDALGAALAIVDRDAAVGLLERLAGDPGFDVAHVDRLIDGIRVAGWQRELVDMPVFAALHARIADSSDVHGVRARVEWTRAVVGRSRHPEAVRWLLDDRSYPRVLGSAEYTEWFRSRAKKAIKNADGAIVELLEIAARHIAPTHLDIVLRHLDSRTLWPPEQHVSALSDLGRPDGVALRLRMAPTGTSEDHASAVAALFDTADGAGLRSAASALAHFLAVRGRSETVNILRDGLAGAYERYRPFRFALGGFEAALEGWTLADLGLRSPAASLAAQAAKWHGETGADALAVFVGRLANGHAAEVLGPALVEDLSGKDGTVAAAIAGLEFPDVLDEPVRLAAGGGRKASAKALRGELAGTGAAGTLDALVAGAVLAQLQAGSDLGTVAERLDALAAAAARADATESTEPADDQVEAAAVPTTEGADATGSGDGDVAAADEVRDVDTDDASDAASEPPSDATGAEDSTVEEATDGAVEAEAGGAESTADPAVAALVARRRETIAKGLSSALRRWAGLAPRLDPAGDETRALLARAAHYVPANHALRAELFAELGGLRDDLRSVGDPRRLLTTDFLDGLTLDVDAADFSALADGLRRVAFTAGADPTVVLDRRSLAVVLPRPVRPEASAEASVPDGPPTTEAVVSDSAVGEPSEGDETAAEAEDVEVEVAETAPAEAEPADASAGEPAAESVVDRVKAGYAADASTDARVAAFGEPGVPLLLRHLAKRNGLSIGVGSHRKRPAVLLKWKDR